MRERVRIVCSMIILSIGNSNASQGGEDYLCTIERFSLAEGDAGASYEMLKNGVVGQQFTIDRASGITVGTLKNSTDSKPTVIDRGNDENSFKVVSMVSADRGMRGTTVTALNVKEFVKGNKKPFNYMINDAVFFGTCVPF